MKHLRTKRKPTAKNISKVIFSVFLVFIFMSIIITLSNQLKIKNINNKILITKNDNINTNNSDSDRAWILDFNKSLYTKKGDQIFVEIADSDLTREIGLSGRQKLKEYFIDNKLITEGMLFSFPTESKPVFWMKDMNFDLDIIWLDHNLKIVYIEKNARTSSYNKENPNSSQFFTSGNIPAKYVLEINSGYFDKMNLKVGDIMRMQ